MTRCSFCNTTLQSGEKPVRIIVEARKKIYPRREQAMRRGRGLTLRWIADPGGVGIETVREVFVHKECAVAQL